MFIIALPTLALVAIIFVIVIALAKSDYQDGKKRAPGPRAWPIIGGIPFMAKFADSTAAFSALAKQYGNVASIKLGVMDCVVLSGYKTFRKVLCSTCFDARPDFKRINMMFGGNRNNSLAFTDYNDTHHKSRNLIAAFSLARNTSSLFETLDTVSTENIVKLVEQVKTEADKDCTVPLKNMLAKSIAKTFLTYFCSTEVKEDAEFEEFVEAFNVIFEEVNEPCVGDILPFAMNFINKEHVIKASHVIRHFVHEKCVNPKLAERKRKAEQMVDENNNKSEKSQDASEIVDLLDAFLDAAENSGDLTLDQALFALEDIIGGHTAVCHTIIRMLTYIAKHPEVQNKIREEARAHSTGVATMTSKLAYTEASAWECLRHISSQIVPHKATEDTEIDGYLVKKDTVVFFNNYDLHFSSDLWDQPQEFKPERFLADGGSRLLKPDYFVPFSTGRRVCLGQKILMKMSVTIIANLCQSFQIGLNSEEDYSVTRCCLAVGNKPYKFDFKRLDC
ncbi:Cytochrome P450, partial [Orchesella cincta]